jgi:hypothetical protein
VTVRAKWLAARRHYQSDSTPWLIERHAGAPSQRDGNWTFAPAPVSREASGATLAVPASSKPDSSPARETLRVGARVLAAYWNEKREFEGFWLAIIKRIDRDEYTLEGFDAPEYPAFTTRSQNIAVLHPEFRLTGK